MRLIDADSLIKDLRAYADIKGPLCGEYGLANGILKAVGRVEIAPTINLHSIPDCRTAEHQLDGRCLGYQCSESDDEPADACKHCPRHTSFDQEEILDE